MADNRKLTAGLLMMPEAQRQDLARMGEDYKRFQEADYLRKMGEQGVGLAKSVARGVPQMATGFVDLAAMPLEYAGVLQPGQAVGSTKWLENKGYLPPPQEGFINQTVEGLASALDPSTMAAHALPAIGMLGKTVWHGSPHTFDKFDLSKIGTGEGAQAYGHGLYLAEAKPTAEGYRDALATARQDIVNNAISRVVNLSGGDTGRVRDALILEGFPRESITPDLEQSMAKIIQNTSPDGTVTDSALKEYNRLEKIVPAEGSLYKVDLPDEQIAKMLDYDLPLSQQSESIKGIFANPSEIFPEGYFTQHSHKTGRDIYLSKSTDVSGDDIYKALVKEKGSPEAASAWLNQQGIPGIQYLDQASRGAGEGTRNYVVFSDEIPQILERNNIPVNK